MSFYILNPNLTKQKQGDTMKKFKSMLFLATLIATAATTTLATDGQIPIGGRPGLDPNKTTATTIATTNTPNNENPIEVSNYLWAFFNAINQFKF